MLPNTTPQLPKIEAEAYSLRRILAIEYLLDISVYEALELASKTNGFESYEAYMEIVHKADFEEYHAHLESVRKPLFQD